MLAADGRLAAGAKPMDEELEALIQRVAAFDVPYPSSPLEGCYLPTVERVVAAALRTLSG